MKAESLATALNYLDDGIISNAAASRERTENGRIRKTLIAAAVLLCITAAASAVLIISNTAIDKVPLTLGISEEHGFGFEGWFFSDISQAENGNPWNNITNIRTLPVYENNLSGENSLPCAINEDEQRKRLNAAAEALGLGIESTQTHYASEVYEGCENDFATSVTAQTNNGSITSNAAGTVTVFFATSRSLPEGCTFDSRENAEKSLREVGTVYKGLSECFFGERDFYCSVTESCNAYGEVTRKYRIYYGKTDKEKILSYNLRYIEFGIDGADRLCSITVNDNLISAEKIGNYPVINEAQAKALLLNGNYITSQVQYEFPGEEYIAKTELVYRAGRDKTIAPYYLFYIELPEAPKENGLTNYGAYYVPAVEEEYLTDFPIYDGEFQ